MPAIPLFPIPTNVAERAGIRHAPSESQSQRAPMGKPSAGDSLRYDSVFAS